MKGITKYAAPLDHFELVEDPNHWTSLPWPCGCCKSGQFYPTDIPCVICGHNGNSITPIQGTLPEILAGAMTFDQMSQLICDIATVIGVEVPSEPHSAETFTVRMVGTVTVAKRRSDAVEEWQVSNLNMMRL